jgi:hypothetical protein
MILGKRYKIENNKKHVVIIGNNEKIVILNEIDVLRRLIIN